MKADMKAMSKKIIPFFIRKDTAGNLITTAGVMTVLVSFTLPVFLKIYAASASYISPAEYLYNLAATGIGSALIAGALILTIAVSLAAAIFPSSILVAAAAGVVLIADSAALWQQHLPLSHLGFGVWTISAGLAAVIAGILLKR